jgi:DNA-binding CsgD family transcriptional regulator
MSELAASSSIVEGFYAAAAGHVPWSDALDRLDRAVPIDHVIMAASGPPFFSTARIGEDDVVRALSSVGDHAYDGPSLDLLHPGKAALRSRMMPDAEYARTLHYNEAIRPLGGFHSIFAKAGAAAPGTSIALCRSARRRDFEAADLTAVEGLLPHLGMAIDISGRLALGSADASTLEALLDGCHEGALICDGARRPVIANDFAQRLLATGDGLAIGLGGLHGNTLEDTRRLRVAIADAERLGASRCLLSRQSRRPPLIVRAAALGHLGFWMPKSRSVALFVSVPDEPLPIDREALAEAFGLTRREVQVAALLAAGADLAAIAGALGVELASVRAYLKCIFQKTGAHTQAALVAMLRGFV